jgi:ATP-grasp domain-containing protein
VKATGPSVRRALIVSIDDHHAYWGAVCLDVAGFDVSVMGARAWGVARLSSRFRAYTSCGLSSLRQSDLSLLEHIDAYCATHRIDWIVPADFSATILLARGRGRITSAGTFPLSDPTLIETWNDKGKFAALVKGLGLPTPRTLLLSSAQDPARRSLPFPVMVKPVRGEGGIGVRRFDRPADLDDALPRLGRRHGWPLLLQEYIPGTDIDLSALADRGRIAAWTLQKRRPENGDLLEFVDHPRVLEIGTELIRRCGYHGLVHFDLRLDERTGEPTFIEANPRFWSSIRHSMWMGVNFPALGIELARGDDLAARFQPALGLCRDPGLSIKSTFRALVRGHWGPEGLSHASAAGWQNHLRDPLPEIWRRLQGFARHHQQAVP